MNRILVIGLMALLGVIAFATSSSQAAAVNVQFDNGAGNGDFTEALNWSDDTAPNVSNNIYHIQNGLTSDLTGTTSSVAGVIVGDASVGTLVVDGGTLDVITDVTVFPHPSGFPTGFSVGGHLSNHTGNGTVSIINGGIVNVIRDPDAPATSEGRDTGFVGERADGTVTIGAGSLLDSPEIIWRVGQFGGFFGADLFEADGIVNVEGTWNADIIFISPNGGDSEINLSGNGSLFTARAFDARAFGNRLFAEAVMRLTGSNVTWNSDDIILTRQVSGPDIQPRPHVIFTSDAGGVSEMMARDALLFNDIEVTVNLTAYGELSFGEKMRLFNARAGQLADGHLVGQLNVLGVADPSQYKLLYQDDSRGDILLIRVPEPASIGLLITGLMGLAAGRRRNVCQ
jgi:hypothetical protein